MDFFFQNRLSPAEFRISGLTIKTFYLKNKKKLISLYSSGLIGDREGVRGVTLFINVQTWPAMMNIVFKALQKLQKTQNTKGISAAQGWRTQFDYSPYWNGTCALGEHFSLLFHLRQYKQKHCSTWKVFGSRMGKITKYL